MIIDLSHHVTDFWIVLGDLLQEAGPRQLLRRRGVRVLGMSDEVLPLNHDGKFFPNRTLQLFFDRLQTRRHVTNPLRDLTKSAKEK